jgi:hypothetical protein
MTTGQDLPSQPAAPTPAARSEGQQALLNLITSDLDPSEQTRSAIPPAPPVWSVRLTESQLDPQCSAALRQDFLGLTGAFDEQAMQGALQAALFDRAHPKATVERCELDQATYVLGESCVLRYLLTLKDSASGQMQEALVSGRLFSNRLDCVEYTDKQLLPLVELMAGREEIALFDRPVALIEPLHMAVHAFPIDGELPTLMGATDRQRLVAILQDALSEAEQQPHPVEECRVELVDYGRQHRCTLRYHTSGPAANGSAHTQLVYGKLTGDGSGAFAGPISTALRERVRDNAGFYFNVPQVLAWRPDLQLSLLEAIPGEPRMADAIKAQLRDKPIASGALSLEQMVDACGQIAATLHTSGIPLGRSRSLDDELAALRRGISHVQLISPDLGTRLGMWLDWLSSYASRSDPLPICFNHGDFTHGQLLFDGSVSGVVDFDSICQAEPALDIGQFLTYLRITSLKSKLTPLATRTIVEQLSERFMRSYIGAAGDRVGDPAQLQIRVSVYKAISLLRRALRSWQKFKPGRIDDALATLEDECAALV